MVPLNIFYLDFGNKKTKAMESIASKNLFGPIISAHGSPLGYSVLLHLIFNFSLSY